MDNIKENKRINYIYQDKKYTREGINNINHTNINNNINITNYYPSSSQKYCSKQTFTFIDENGSVQNAISYPIKTITHKTKKIKESSPTTNPYDKKYYQCQSPYMKKILPNSKRQKSEEGNRIINIYKNSPSTNFIKNTRKKSLKNHNFYNNNTNSMRKEENQNNININNNKQINRDKNFYLDLSSDDINNKYKSNKIYNNNNNNNYDNNYLNNDYKVKPEINKIKYKNYKTFNRPIMANNQLMTSYESNGNESHANILDKPYQISMNNKQPKYKITSFEKNNYISYNNFNSPKLVKSQKNININYKKGISLEKKISKYIILIQSVIRGYLLRIKLVQYLNLYERIKKAVSFIQYIIFKRKKYILYYLIKNNINKKLFNYFNNNSYLIPVNNIFFEIKKINIKHNKTSSNENNNKKIFTIKNIEASEIQKELNKKKIDFAVAEKRIKELLLENKKMQNINKIIVRDNKQLALKLKNSQNNKTNILKAQNTNFYILNISNKNEIKINKNYLLRKIIVKKEIKAKAILYKYFYKYNLKSKLLYISQINEKEKNNKKNYVMENNNNFIINHKNDISNISNNVNNKDINIDKRNKILNIIIKKKNFNLYIYRNIFEKWMMRTLIFKNKEFIKEKKKKKKEKFKQRKQKKLYGNLIDKNNKKNDEENENENSGDSEDFDIEQKYSNKSGSSKKNNYYDENNEK